MGELQDLRTRVDKLKIILSNSTSNFSPIASAKVIWKKCKNSMFANNTYTAKITEGTKVYVFPHLTNESLISVGQLCDDGCIVFFTQNHFYVTKNDQLIIKGNRNPSDGLWDFNKTINPLQNNTNNVNYIITKNKTKLDLARYFHASLFSPSISKLQKAIKRGNLITWPGINNLSFNKLIGITIATEMDHLNQERKNLQSTKDKKSSIDLEFPPISTEKQKTFSLIV